MDKTVLGRTGLTVSRVGFGVLPLQRTPMETAKRILIKAYENGITFFDTARAYSDSEEKIGNALSDVRKDIIIATKTHSADVKTFWQHLKTSLTKLKTDYIDIYQFHNPGKAPGENDELYQAAKEAKEKGYIRHVGVTNHSRVEVLAAADSDLYDTVQYPLSHISSEEDMALTMACKDKDIGFIAMKALSGGLITDAETAFSFFWQYPHIVPIWGIQREEELDQFLSLARNPPPMTTDISGKINRDRKELAGAFCRGCGYCLPCPAGIPIPSAARMKYMLRRLPYQQFITDSMREQMSRIRNCQECNQCVSRCPYHLNTPALLKEMLADYEDFIHRLQ